MRNKGIAVLAVSTATILSLFCQGCIITRNRDTETKSLDMGQNSQKTSFREQALDELEKYRVKKDIGVQGFFLGKKLTETPIKEAKIDEMSGCLINRFVDDLFGIILVYTDSNGVIVRIGTMRQFDSWFTAKEFYNNLRKTVSDKYPATPAEGGRSEENFHWLQIMGTNDEEDWIRSYITSLELKKFGNKPVRSYRHYMILHPYLYTLNVRAGELNGGSFVSVDYDRRQYHYMLNAVKRKTRNEMDRALD